VQTWDVAADAAGSVYVAEADHHRIRKVDASGAISTVAGTGVAGFGGDGLPAPLATLDLPLRIALDGAGNLYISDTNNERVRRIDAATGTISTVAGNGERAFSSDGGQAARSALSIPVGLAAGPSGEVYIGEVGAHRVRKVDTGGTRWTVAGTGCTHCPLGDGGPATAATAPEPWGLAAGARGDLLIADASLGRVRQVTGGVIEAVAGAGDFSRIPDAFGDGGPAVRAFLRFPMDVVAAEREVLIADTGNDRVRVVERPAP
jgi:hypothetical protein